MAFSSGWRRCICSIDLVLLSVSGVATTMTAMVSKTMARAIALTHRLIEEGENVGDEIEHLGLLRGGDRVIAVGSPRMTPTQSFRGEPAAAYCTVAVEGLQRVVRTRRHMPARRPAAGEQTLVAPYTRNEGRARSDSSVRLGREERRHGVAQRRVGPVVNRRSHPDQVITSSGKDRILSMKIVQYRSNSPTTSVSNHRISHRAWDCKREPRASRGWFEARDQSNRPATVADAFSTKSCEVRSADEPIDHADKRARPLWRRERRTARPPRVLIRERKPCFFARLRTLG